MTKKERWDLIEQQLLTHPQGLRQIDVVKRLGSNRSTISRDIQEMSLSYPIIESDDGLLRMDKSGYLHTVKLSMHQLEALHLSARLFAKVMRFPFPHAAGALRKLADAQGRVSLALADRIRETAEELDAFAVDSGNEYAHYSRIIEDLGIAISENRPVKIVHFSSTRQDTTAYLVAPVTLEPHHEGKAVHLVAWDEHAEPPFFRTLKIERIELIELLDPDYELYQRIPFEAVSGLFKDAWSIWRKEGTEEVVLHFSPVVAGRVAETQWHSSQRLEPKDDGSLVWRGRIAQPKEMYPWIRGWGPDVQVLKPQWLKEMHKEDFLKGMKLYE